MRIQLPKPLNGWRQFAGEVGVIVLGVFIALAAQEAISEWRWRQEVDLTRAALDREILINVATAAERAAVNRCLTQRVSELATAIAQSNGHWIGSRLEPTLANAGHRTALPLVYRAPNRIYTTDAWEIAKSTGVLGHMPGQEVRDYSADYEQIIDMRGLNDAEQNLIPSLTFLAFDGKIDPASRARALTTLATLDSHNAWIVVIGSQLADAARRFKGRYDSADRREIEQLLARQRTFRGNCVDESAANALLGPLSAP